MFRGGNRGGFKGRGGGRSGGRDGGRRTEASVPKLPDPDGVPILRPGKNGNYPYWIKQVRKAAVRLFGDLGRLYTDDVYFVPPPLDVDGIDLDQQWNAQDQTVEQYIQRTILIQEAKNRTSLIEEMRNNRPKMYAWAELHLSTASEELVKARPNWGVMSTQRDPLLQHQAIKATHIVENSGDAFVDAQEARDQFARLRMHGNTVPEFYQEFEFAVDALKATDQTYYTDSMLASEFISKLDGRFMKMKVDIENGAIPRPATLADAFQRASRYKVAPSATSGYGQMTSLLASSSSFRGRGGRGGRGRGRGEKEKNAEESGGKRKGESITAAADSANSAEEKRIKYKCYYCKETGHFIRDCPKLAEKNGGNLTGVAFSDGGDDDEDQGYSLISAVSFDELIASVNFLGQLDEYGVLLDSGANKSIWKHMNILVDVRTDAPISTRGVNGRFVTDTVGRLEGFFDIYGSYSAVANILSLSECEDRFARIDYKKGQYYRVYVDETYYIEFRRRYGIYIGNLREYLG